MATHKKEWHAPTGAERSEIFLLNTLKDEKVPFVPAAGPDSKEVTWYICGPTVYDVSHLGHARNYLTFDIIRRVFEDYFGFRVKYVMNVTDVDDKIIARARRNYLLQQYKAGAPSASEVKRFAEEATAAAQQKQECKITQLMQELAAENNPKKKEALQEQIGNEDVKLDNIKNAAAALQSMQDVTLESVLQKAGDYVSEALDIQKGAEVTDQAIFQAHSSKYEREFFEDMEALGWRRPTDVTRVTEYIPQIVAYIARIIENGFAYAKNGSVYFGTQQFKDAGHKYGKLNPAAVGSASLAAEGEANFENAEKNDPRDFALWKASKPGEPCWDSDWGKGRPGWHIECSAMASAILGSKIDLHSGGSDLMFPHHDNEIAQAEAHYHGEGCDQWVNYWLHSGHLHIKDRKMSKSLKNFITIKEVLRDVSPRQLRLMFVLNPWHRPMSYNDASFEEMRAKESQLMNFFENVDASSRKPGEPAGEDEPAAVELIAGLETADKAVRAALQDNIDTKGAMDRLGDLIKAFNVYQACIDRQPGKRPNPDLVRKVADFVRRILGVFGIEDFGKVAADAEAAAPYLTPLSQFRDKVRALAQWKAPKEPSAANGSDSAADRLEAISRACDDVRDNVLPHLAMQNGHGGDGAAAKHLDTIKAFRDEICRVVQGQACEAGEGSDVAPGRLKAILRACDDLRDNILPELGVRLQDTPDGVSMWTVPGRDVLLAEKAKKLQEQKDAARKKVENTLQQLQKERAKWAGLAVGVPEALGDKYRFDEQGEPTHDKEGNLLEGKALAKAAKDVAKARKDREPYVKRLKENPDFLDSLEQDISRLQEQLQAL